MTSSHWLPALGPTRRWLLALVSVLAGAVACENGIINPSTGGPATLEAEPIALGTIRLAWPSVDDPDVSGYVIERRTNLSGAFTPLTDEVLQSAGEVIFFDEGLEPETFYGYRVRAVTRFGERSGASSVAGALTPAMPGIAVAALTSSPNAQSSDNDGYFVSISGPATSSGSLGPLETRRFNPLPPGSYTVTLSGIRPNCHVQGDSVRLAEVTDQGVATITTLRYDVTCRDPNRGSITVVVTGTGDSLDADGYLIDVQGIADDATLPDTARVFTRLVRVPSGTGGTQLFDNLRPGSYIVTLLDVAANCTLQGAAARSLPVAALGSDSLAYTVSCIGDDPDTGNRPYVWTNQFVPQSATAGQKVTLQVSLDLTATPGQDLSAVQAELLYDHTVLRFDSASPGQLDQLTSNASTPGLISWLAFTTGSKPAGNVPLARFNFTVQGNAGTSRSRTTLQIVAGGDEVTQIDTLVRVVEDTFTIGSGPGNAAPTAEANGPYTGVAGTALTFSAAGSLDPDGTIASHAWAFTDGGSASGANPTHTFSSAGTYIATLTVTDNLGATSTDQATVTISSAGGGNLPPTAQANGPYSGSIGTAITFSSAGSADPDGSIVSYSWSFGDGGTGSGAGPSHTYSTAGTHTVTLTVTDNLGSTASDQATVTVTDPGSSTPFTWAASFGSINPADSLVALTISYDLSGNIVETPGAEALQSWVVDSLNWNPAVLRYHSFNFGPGGFGSVNPTFALSQGRLEFTGTQPAGNSTGLIVIATVRFKVIGSPGSSTTTTTSLGNLIGTAATGSYNYRSKTATQEATITAP